MTATSAKRRPRPKSATASPLRIAIISDIHAYDGIEPDKAPSHCCITENDPTKNPLSGLRQLIANESLRADLLFCPGDLGEKAQPSAIHYAWGKLHELKGLLKAKHLVATTGNHDIDSRHAYNHHDAKGQLQTLDPKYPFASDGQNDKYWSRHFATIVGPTYRILNSSSRGA
jgi:predicted MPP superfamily phosphohydrolase